MAVNLVLRASGLGDLLTGIPALRALRRAWPDDWLMLAAPRGLQPLIPMIGAVDELVPTAGLAQFLSDLHRYDIGDHDQHRFDHDRRPDLRPKHAVNLHGRGPQSIDCLQALHPEILISHAHPDRPGVDGPRWDDRMNEIDRWCALLEAYGISADRSDLRLDPPAGPSPCPGAAVIHPGATYRARRWPPARFAEVARTLHREGHRVVITGKAYERKMCCWIAARAGLPEEAVLAGRTDLGDFAAVVSGAELVICGDTGTGQLATALDTPSVLLFGPTPPSCLGPTASRNHQVALWAGHTGDPLGSRPDPGLLKLQVDDVLDSAHKVLRAA
jgi:ADP-heptose:LPS heptosyltransferase